ncbi:hypothetical protein BH24CHL7_BH24CHL7_14270 [soil metagenome]
MIYNQHSIHAQHRLRTRQLREAARRERLVARRPQRRIRRLVGRSMVTIGSRLVADPINEPARSR